MQNPTIYFAPYKTWGGLRGNGAALHCHLLLRASFHIHIMGRLAQGHDYILGRRPSFLVFPLLMVFFCMPDSPKKSFCDSH